MRVGRTDTQRSRRVYDKLSVYSRCRDCTCIYIRSGKGITRKRISLNIQGRALWICRADPHEPTSSVEARDIGRRGRQGARIDLTKRICNIS